MKQYLDSDLFFISTVDRNGLLAPFYLAIQNKVIFPLLMSISLIIS